MKFCKVRPVKSPTRGTDKSAGIDFFVPGSFRSTTVPPHTDILIPSGIKAAIPKGYMLIGADKSGVVTSQHARIQACMGPKKDAFNSPVIIGAKIIDEDYQGEIHIHLINTGDKPVNIEPGMKIAQFILVPVSYEMPEEVSEGELFGETTKRGQGGFGSTNGY